MFCFIKDSTGGIIITNEGQKILIVQVAKWKECIGTREAIPWLITILQIFVVNIVKMITFDVDPCLTDFT